MSELNDYHFLERIQDHPDDRYAVGIYADWLEEQGSPRAAVIQDFQQAVAGDDAAFERLHQFFDERVGTWKDLVATLPPDRMQQFAINCAWLDEYVRNTKSAQDFLVLCWRRSLGLISTFDALYVARLNYRASPGAMDIVNHASYYGHDFITLYHEETREYYLIAASYAMFGLNVLPGSFETSGLV